VTRLQSPVYGYDTDNGKVGQADGAKSIQLLVQQSRYS